MMLRINILTQDDCIEVSDVLPNKFLVVSYRRNRVQDAPTMETTVHAGEYVLIDDLLTTVRMMLAGVKPQLDKHYAKLPPMP